MKEEAASGGDRDEGVARDELAPNNAGEPTASAINDAYERGMRDQERARARQETALAAHISELMELQHRRQLRSREKQSENHSGDTLAETLKTVKQLSKPLHTAEQFGELSYKLQRELYDYSNGRLYAFLIRSLGEDFSQMIPAETAGGPRHSDGL